MKKFVLVAGLVGVIIPPVISLVGVYLDHFGHKGLASAFSSVVLWLWPTGLFLIDAEENFAGYVAFTISIVLNGALYAGIVWFVTFVWSAIRYREE